MKSFGFSLVVRNAFLGRADVGDCLEHVERSESKTGRIRTHNDKVDVDEEEENENNSKTVCRTLNNSKSFDQFGTFVGQGKE